MHVMANHADAVEECMDRLLLMQGQVRTGGK